MDRAESCCIRTLGFTVSVIENHWTVLSRGVKQPRSYQIPPNEVGRTDSMWHVWKWGDRQKALGILQVREFSRLDLSGSGEMQ